MNRFQFGVDYNYYYHKTPGTRYNDTMRKYVYKNHHKFIQSNELKNKKYEKIDHFCNNIVIKHTSIHTKDDEGRLHSTNDEPAVESRGGYKEWRLHGKLHRNNDNPAVIWPSGTKEWWFNGKKHREGGKPALVYASGRVEYWVHGVEVNAPSQSSKEDQSTKEEEYPKKTITQHGNVLWKDKDGQIHNDNDQPAFTRRNGSKEWYQHGSRHRDDDKPAMVYDCGYKSWWQHGKRHRDGDQPAIIHSSGRKEWYQHGKKHRDGGKPAIEYKDGTKEWWVNGERQEKSQKSQNLQRLQRNICSRDPGNTPKPGERVPFVFVEHKENPKKEDDSKFCTVGSSDNRWCSVIE